MLLLGLRVPFIVRSEDEMDAESAADKGEEGADPAPKKARVEEGKEEEVHALELLLEVFLRGEGKKYNPNANYDFLASVFANVSTVSSFSTFLGTLAALHGPADSFSLAPNRSLSVAPSSFPPLRPSWNPLSSSSSPSPSTLLLSAVEVLLLASSE